MTKQVQRRRGTATQHTSFTGAEGEISVNTTNKSVHVHDGSTAGGIEAARADLGNVSDADLNTALSGNTLASLTITSADINGGTIDGASIGATTAAAGSFTSLTASGTFTATSGTIDGTTIGGTTAAAITGTTGQFNTSLNVDGTVTADGLTVDGGAVINTAQSSSTTAFDSPHLNLDIDAQTDNTGFTGITYATSTASNYGWSAGAVRGSSGVYSSFEYRSHENSNSGNLRFKLENNGDLSLYEDTGTTPKFFWDASAESLGLGTTAPNVMLHLESSTDSPAIRLKNTATGGSDYYIQSYVSGGVDRFRIGETGGAGEVFTIAGGNVGIGTSSPSAQLTVSNSAGASIDLDDPNAATDSKTRRIYSSNHELYFSRRNDDGTLKANDMVIDASGNVGIGTSSPAQKLDVTGSTSSTQARFGGTAGRGLEISTATTFSTPDAVAVLNAPTSTYGTMIFQTQSTERMRITSSGSVGIGTSSPSGLLELKSTTSNAYLYITADNASSSRVYLGDEDSGTIGRISYNHAFNYMDFYVNGSEAMRINSSGQMLLGRTSGSTSSTDDGLAFIPAGYYISNVAGTTSATHAFFQRNGNTTVGTITSTGSSTSYNTASDYRLKEDWQPLTGASKRVFALNPVNFAWKADGTRVDGFLAHEAQEVVPEAVYGVKDGMRTEEYEVTPAVLDEEGNVVTEAVMGTREVPDYQGIDQSKLVPLLTAALQEALKRIEALEAKL